MRAIAPTAQALHARMYTAFAEGDIVTLADICGGSLLSSFKAQIAARPPTERVVWRLHTYMAAPRLMSHLAAQLPIKSSDGSEAAIRQAVVRIRSVQSLERWLRVRGRDGTVKEERVDEAGDGREITEFLVLQQKLMIGKQDKWKVWGTVEEASLAEVLAEDAGGAEGKAAG